MPLVTDYLYQVRTTVSAVGPRILPGRVGGCCTEVVMPDKRIESYFSLAAVVVGVALWVVFVHSVWDFS